MLNKIKKGGFADHITLKVGRMRKAKEFTIYPYSGGDEINLQSKRYFIILNLRTGIARMNKKGVNRSTRLHVTMNPLEFEFPKEGLNALKEHLWENDGKTGGNDVCKYDNEKLYSKTSNA